MATSAIRSQPMTRTTTHLLYDKGTLLDDNDDAIANDNALFDVSSGGQISLKEELDYENPGTGKDPNVVTTDDIPDGVIVYTVVVKATDPSGAPTSQAVSVYLMDVNEAPEFTDASTVDAQKTLYIIENVDTVTLRTGDADDDDEPANYVANDDDNKAGTNLNANNVDTVTYKLEGDDAEDFTIDDSSGDLGVAAALTPNYEEQSSYSITIVAMSTGTDRDTKYGKLDVTIKVVNTEDDGEVTFNAREPQIDRTVLAKLDDEDGSETGIKWQWYRGGDDDVNSVLDDQRAVETDAAVACADNNPAADNDPCMIDGANSAVYDPDDDDDGHRLQVVATYKDAIDSDMEERAVGVTEREVQASDPANTAPSFPDQDFNTPGDQSDTATRSVVENEKDAMVGEPVEATDGNNDLLIYSISGADAASFKIGSGLDDATEGQLMTAEELDFETKSSYEVVVIATDPSGAYDMITVMITVTDENDDAVITSGPAVNTAPAFDAGTATRNVGENMDADTDVGDPVMAMDEDSGDTVTYALSGSMYFKIDENSGQISTTMMLDHEAMSTHTVTVTATDSAGDSASIDVTINVTNAHTGCDTAGNMGLVNDCEALLDSKDALGGSLNWADDTAMSDWDGVTMSDGRVTAVNLRDQGLDGTIPAALGRLSALTSLNLRSNADLSGEIPGALNYLANLTVLNLHSNSHTGEIPDLSGTMLNMLILPSNELTGSVPAWLNTMTDMTELWLWGNQLTGALPDLSGMTSLEILKLNGNMVSGFDAAMLPGGLRWLVAGETDMGSTAPDLSSLMSLTTLWMNENGLTGAVPVSNIPASVTSLNLKGNMLSGTIPDMSSLTNLEYLRLHRNELSGDIPGTLGDLDSIARIWLYENDLTGISAGLANAADTLTHLYLNGNSFAEGTCLRGGLDMVANNDFEDAGLAACGDGS